MQKNEQVDNNSTTHSDDYIDKEKRGAEISTFAIRHCRPTTGCGVKRWLSSRALLDLRVLSVYINTSKVAGLERKLRSNRALFLDFLLEHSIIPLCRWLKEHSLAGVGSKWQAPQSHLLHELNTWITHTYSHFAYRTSSVKICSMKRPRSIQNALPNCHDHLERVEKIDVAFQILQ